MKFNQFKKPFRILYYAAKRFHYEKFAYRVSALTFSLLLAIVPYLLVSIFLFTHLPGLLEMALIGRGYMVQHFIPAVAARVEIYFYGFIHQASSIPALNILFLFISVTLMLSTIEDTLNEIWMVPNRYTFNIVSILNWIFFLLLPFIIGLSVFISAYFFSLTWVTTATNWIGISKLLLICIPILINSLIFSLIYVLIPNVNVSWREGFSCGFLAALLFEAARFVFEWYITKLADYTIIYGIFAIIPIFLIWIYVFWFIIIFSALIIQENKQIDARENNI